MRLPKLKIGFGPVLPPSDAGRSDFPLVTKDELPFRANRRCLSGLTVSCYAASWNWSLASEIVWAQMSLWQLGTEVRAHCLTPLAPPRSYQRFNHIRTSTGRLAGGPPR